VLDPVERQMEALFGLIMVLSFTGTMSVATAARADVHEMLIGALGCNLAWGIVDAVMYVLTNLLDRGRGLRSLHEVRRARDPELARSLIADVLPPLVASVLRPTDLDYVHEQLTRLPEPPVRSRPTMADLRGAVGVFFIVFLSTFPVALPFVFIPEPQLALRVSNGIAVALLFVGGYSLARYAGLRPILTGLAMLVIGVVLVAITIALGG
jgi:hypothetical protein